MNDDELKKLGEDLRRTDRLLVAGALVFALVAVILAGLLAYVWFTRG